MYLRKAQEVDLLYQSPPGPAPPPTKGQAELAQTELGPGYSFSLRCQRCGRRDESPTRERIAKGV